MSGGDNRPTARLRNLQPGWDSYGARPPDADVLDVADRVVVALGALGLHLQVVPLSSGGVSLHAARGPVEFELSIGPRSEFELLIVDGDGEVLEAAGVPPEEAR